jgi:hypothetical protein
MLPEPLTFTTGAAVKQLRLDDPAAGSPAVPPAQRPTIGAPSTSDLLGRLQQFLPAMQSANAQLATAPATVRSSPQRSNAAACKHALASS